MMRAIVSRLGWSLLTLVGMSLVAFALPLAAPGDPVMAQLRFLGVPAQPDTIERLRAEFALDAPWPQRYVQWLSRVVRADLGTSIATGRPVAHELAVATPQTMELAATALALTIAISLAAGVGAAQTRTTFVAALLHGATVVVGSMPVFLIGLVVLSTLGARLGWLSVIGGGAAGTAIAAATLALAPGLAAGRLVRQRILDERREDHVRLAVVMGRTPVQVLWQDIAPAIAPAILAVWTTAYGALLGGSVVVERLFDRPGLGSLALHAIDARDYPVLQAYLLLSGAVFVAVSWAGDLLAAWLDPRLRRTGIHA